MARPIREIPVRLQDGKAYVTREGLTVYAKWNELTQRFLHDRDEGPLTIRAIPVAENGRAEKSRDDIVRPAYVMSGRYQKRTGSTMVIHEVDDDTAETYRIHGTHTIEGWYYEGGTVSEEDLMDYEGGYVEPEAVPEPSPVEALAELPKSTPEIPRPFNIGDLVRVSDDYRAGGHGMPNVGTVVSYAGDSVGVSFSGWDGGHNLPGAVSGECGWFIPPEFLTSHQAAVESVREKSGYVFTAEDAAACWDRFNTAGMNWQGVVATRARIFAKVGEVIPCD